MSFDSLVSKIAAGGLSAGVFLFWWAEHVPGDDLAHLVVRGLLWTLTFELLLCAFAPLERLVRARLKQRTDARRAVVRDRLAAAPAPARTGGAVALAALGIAGPLVLLADAPRQLAKDADARPRVVRQVIVERPVIKREIVVRRVVGAAAAEAAASRTQTTPASPPATAAGVPARRAASRPARRTTVTRNAATRKVAGTVERTDPPAAPATEPATAQTTAAPAPAATEPPVAPQP